MNTAEEAENHWPGYVDALTTMVMILIFVMMILSVAFFSASANTSRALVERIAQTMGVSFNQPSASGEEMADKLVDMLQHERRKGNTGTSASEAPPPAFNTQASETVVRSQATALADTSAGKVRVEAADTSLTLYFQPRAVNVDEGSLQELDTFFKATRNLPQPVNYKLFAHASSRGGALSDARRIAYYRAMFARQKLIAQGVSANDIEVRVEDHTEEAQADKLRILVRAARGPAPEPTSGAGP